MSATRTGSTATTSSAGSYELEVAGERVPASLFLEPPYDPKDRRSEPEIVATVSRSANDADTGSTHGLAQIPHVSVPLTSSAAGPL